MHKKCVMDEVDMRKRKESHNGSTGESMIVKTKEEQHVRATVLQKDVSMCVRVPDCVSIRMSSLVYECDQIFTSWGPTVLKFDLKLYYGTFRPENITFI